MTPAERAAIAERNAEIRQWRKDGSTLEQVAARFSVSLQTVRKVMASASSRGRVRGRPCPSCGHASELLWVRERADGSLKRRRKCQSCGHRWNSIEIDEDLAATATGGRDDLV